MQILLALLAACAIIPRSFAQNDGTSVNTAEGPVVGTLSSDVRQFLGIPYAVANRWEAPQPAPSRTTAFQAKDFGDSCLQALGGSSKEFLVLVGLGNQDVTESENCHSVNIWAPSLNRKQGTAVMLWIYGGGFGFGTSNTVYYHGQNIVQEHEDVLVVSFNYRLNIFGQPSAPQLQSSSNSVNFGLLDLRAAVEWVHSNIAAFGGDPERIILFGESAGGLSADAYAYAYPNDNIVKGMIQESGSLGGNSVLAPQENVTSVAAWNSVASQVGCGSNPTPEQFSCMKAVPFRQLEDAVISTSVSFAPTPDGITYFSDFTARSKAGNFLKVPLLVGNNAQEGDIFVVALELLNLGFAIPGLTQIGSEAVTHLVFLCPAGITADDRVKAGVPTWRYRYEAVFPDMSPRSDLRAFHASEIPIVFGTYNSSTSTAPPSADEIALSKYVQSAWVAFARNPAQGLTNFGWPTYKSSAKTLAELGNDANKTGVTFTSGDHFDLGCTFFEASVKLVEEILGKAGGIV